MANPKVRSPENMMMIEIANVLQQEQRYAISIRRIMAIERRFLPLVSAKERVRSQRFVARMAFSVATDKDASFASIAKRFRVRCELGFEDELSELPVLIEYGFACAEFGKKRIGLKVLGDAQSRLGESERDPSSEFVRQMFALIEKCQRLLD